MRLSPTLSKLSVERNGGTDVQSDVDFWYDTINKYKMTLEMDLFYLEAITDADYE